MIRCHITMSFLWDVLKKKDIDIQELFSEDGDNKNDMQVNSAPGHEEPPYPQ